jgi:pyruvate,water dikinase
VLQPDYPGIHLLASVDKWDYLQPIYAPGALDQAPLVLTFDQLLENPEFVTLMRSVLSKLERHYGRPVDIEFTVEITGDRPPHFILHLLQCRPLSSQEWGESLRIPSDLPSKDVVFLTRRLVPHGRVSRIRYVVYVDPAQYAQVPNYETRFELARVVGRLNKRLEGECFILMGPGRWGTSNVELGVKVTYADIYNTRVLIEIAQSRSDNTLEVSYGTHFFQDLVEARIYPLPLYPNGPGTVFNRAFFDEAPNLLEELLPADAQYAPYIKVIDVPALTGGRYLELVMDSERDEALAYFKRYPAGER